MTSTMLMDMARKKRSDSALAENLVAARKARGMTQIQLAEAIESSQRAISSYENGVSYPSPPVLAALSRVLRVSADALLGLKRPPRSKVPTDDPEVRRAWNKFRQLLVLPEKDQRAVIRLVNSLVSVHGSE